MPQLKRKKDGKTQYRSTYRWKDSLGTTHQTTTTWKASKLEADTEAKRLSKLKTASTNTTTTRRNKKVISILEDYIVKVDGDVNDETLKNKSSQITLLQRLKALEKYYFPEELKNTYVKEVDTAYFRRWIEYLNRQKISGPTLRTYKTTIQKFNKYMADNGYYDNYNADIENSMAISRVEIKSRKTGIRKDRRTPNLADIEALRRYYEDDLGRFRNFYYYTFFYFEFYTGCRVSETIALLWKDVDLREEKRVIHIRNAINAKEKRETALKRTQVGNFSTKNETSERGVVIFDIIYKLLKDYKNRYKIHYKMSNIEDCFVFPALKNPYNYASHNHLLEELKRACIGAGIDELDNGMFRHGCATMLVAPPPDGLGFNPEQVYSQLGHCDSSMINEIYGKLQKDQMTQKNRIVFNKIYHPEEDLAYQEDIKELEDIINRVQGNNGPAEVVSKLLRFMMELERIKYSDNKVFYYFEDDEEFIKQYNFLKEKYPEIKFVMRKN